MTEMTKRFDESTNKNANRDANVRTKRKTLTPVLLVGLFSGLIGINSQANESSSFLLQMAKSQGGANIFFEGNTAKTIYNLIAPSIPTESLPNGSYAEGGNIACSKITDASKETYACALNFGKDGLTKAKTPTFDRTAPTVSGELNLTPMIAKGLIHMRIKGDTAKMLSDILKVAADTREQKIAKNVLCRKEKGHSCSFLINQRGFADFPETDLK